jgi:hypothetical protein
MCHTNTPPVSQCRAFWTSVNSVFFTRLSEYFIPANSVILFFFNILAEVLYYVIHLLMIVMYNEIILVYY